ELVADTDLPETTSPAPLPTANAPLVVTPSPHKPKVHRPEPAATKEVTEGPAIIASNRKVLPPLDIDVVAGDSHRPARPTNNSLRIEMAPNQAAPAPQPQSPKAVAKNAG